MYQERCLFNRLGSSYFSACKLRETLVDGEATRMTVWTTDELAGGAWEKTHTVTVVVQGCSFKTISQL